MSNKYSTVVDHSRRTDWENEKSLLYTLTHEMVHIRHLDGVKKLGLTAAVCVHWFNPFVWVMYSMANRDMELACDEETVHITGENSGLGIRQYRYRGFFSYYGQDEVYTRP